MGAVVQWMAAALLLLACSAGHMIAAMTARIVFSEGATVTVTAEAEEVRNTLAKDKQGGEPFTQFEEQGGRDVYVAADRVAYVQWISSQA
jgi:hypothetical protein